MKVLVSESNKKESGSKQIDAWLMLQLHSEPVLKITQKMLRDM
jgi:hypothetical protein